MSEILIVEDNPETRAQLSQHIAAHADLNLSAAVGTVAEALQILDANGDELDVLLVDLGLPDGNGEQVIRHACNLNSPPEIMVITVFGDERHVISAIEAGATGYLLKDSSSDSLGDAVRELLAGGSPITPVIARHILKRFTGSIPIPASNPAPVSEPPNVPDLTPREIEVLRIVARGYTNNEIAELLEMSFHTVTSHVKHIYRKLSVRSRSGAIFEATQLGLLDGGRE